MANGTVHMEPEDIFHWQGTHYKCPLEIRYANVSCPNGTKTSFTFTEPFTNDCLVYFAYGVQGGFGAASTITVYNNDRTKYGGAVYQTNTANATMSVGVIGFGY